MRERQVLTTTCRIGGTCRPVPAGPALGRLLPSPASKSSWASLLVASLLGLAALVGVFFVDNRRRMRARAG